MCQTWPASGVCLTCVVTVSQPLLMHPANEIQQVLLLLVHHRVKLLCVSVQLTVPIMYVDALYQLVC